MKVYVLTHEYTANGLPDPVAVTVYESKQKAIDALDLNVRWDKVNTWCDQDQTDVYVCEGEIEEDTLKTYIQEEEHNDDGNLIGWTFYENGEYCRYRNEYHIEEHEIK